MLLRVRDGHALVGVEALLVGSAGREVQLQVEYAGPAPDFFGLDQINVVLTPDLEGLGVATVRLLADGADSNAVSYASTWGYQPSYYNPYSWLGPSLVGFGAGVLTGYAIWGTNRWYGGGWWGGGGYYYNNVNINHNYINNRPWNPGNRWPGYPPGYRPGGRAQRR